MKMTRLRNVIMADFDTWDEKKRNPNPSLTREVLEHWMKGKYLSVTPFRYIDYWIRKNRNKPPLSDALDDLIEYTEDKHRKVFSELYTNFYRIDHFDTYKKLDSIKGKLFVSKLLEIEKISDDARQGRDRRIGGFRQIAVYFRSRTLASVSVTAVYLRNPLSELRPDPSLTDIMLTFGYMTVEDAIHIMDGKADYLTGPLHLFRETTRGYRASGTTVSRFDLNVSWNGLNIDWYLQMSSQISAGSGLDLPPPVVVDGAGKPMERLSLSGNQFGEEERFGKQLSLFLKNLKNKSLIW